MSGNFNSVTDPLVGKGKTAVGNKRPIIKSNTTATPPNSDYIWSQQNSPAYQHFPLQTSPGYRQQGLPAPFVYGALQANSYHPGLTEAAASTTTVCRQQLAATNGHLATELTSTTMSPSAVDIDRLTDSIACVSNISRAQSSSTANGKLDTKDLDSDSSEDSDSDDGLTHPNKFPVEIEYHENQYCVYKRQPTRSGPKIKQRKSTVYNPTGPTLTGNEVQQVKYYQKDLVRICRCGKYNQMDGALIHGRANDCDGYEIHYNQKCKWKAYDDYKTGKRVLIRLCKCYKPML